VEFHTEELEAKPFVFIRVPTTIAEIGPKIGACMGQLGPYIGANAAGPVVARWTDWDQEKLAGTMEVGMPVRAAMPGQGEIQSGELPAGRMAVGEHVGSNEGLNAAWQKFGSWINKQGMECRGDPWEEYISDPGVTPQEECVTRLVWPV
jgi:effector-binding domain-containing protein